MGAAPALDFTYQYPFASGFGQTPRGQGLRLATCSAHQEHPHFFDARLLHPEQCGKMLLVLSDVVRTHFFLPKPDEGTILDPVVTTNEHIVRFEGFSACCGVYARVDLPAASFDADLAGRGTTNVDFNTPMRAALARMRDRDDTRLCVGLDEVAIERAGESVVEKKVKLPIRWLKGFSEVQAYQPALTPTIEVSGAEARRFVRSMPRSGSPKRPIYVTQRGKGLGTTHRAGPGTAQFAGTNRVRALEPLMNAADKLTIWTGDSGVSAWQVDSSAGRFFLMLSPELYRGFSGEGQVLQKLATGDYESALAAVRAQLAWQPHIDTKDLATKAACDPVQAEAALAVLGSRGLAGYDLTTQSYFHRELPFDLDLIESLQPRLKNARKLLDDDKVTPIKQIADDAFDIAVEGTGVTHHVRLRPDGDRCTCPWFSKHQGGRGPCKHLLAARLFISDQTDQG